MFTSIIHLLDVFLMEDADATSQSQTPKTDSTNLENTSTSWRLRMLGGCVQRIGLHRNGPRRVSRCQAAAWPWRPFSEALTPRSRAVSLLGWRTTRPRRCDEW